MKSLAVIGTGIAGMACSYLLRDKYTVTVYEKNHYIGGHTNTVMIDEGARKLPIDTGFMVYNERTYPNLVKLFKLLQVDTMDTSMSFSVSNRSRNFEASFSNLSTFFPHAGTWFQTDRYRLLLGLRRLFSEAKAFLDSPDSLPALTLGEFISIYEIPSRVIDHFLLPMTSAIWSSPGKKMTDYPAATLFNFLRNHGMLGFGEQLQWKTVKGGSRQYKDRILQAIGSRVRVGVAAEKLQRIGSKVAICDSDGQREEYDYAIVATHADHALALLDAPNRSEATLLAPFKYNSNPVCLHCDESVMPRSKRAWASWNYKYEIEAGETRGSTHYWMNSLQKVSQNQNYFVSVDYYGPLQEEKVKWRYLYEHPRFDGPAIAAQKELPTLNRKGPVYFCGSYFRHGFHEDALASALAVCAKLNDGKDPLA